MELWWRLRGWVRLRLTSAECISTLGALSREHRLEDIVVHHDLVADFTVLRTEVKKLRIRPGETLEQVCAGGLPVLLGRLRRWRLLAVWVLLLGVLTMLLSTRILFVRVVGNGEVPARLILEQAEVCGVRFGASTRALRSEQVKNHLLWAIPELRWAGVNTQGCVATITVAVRQTAPEESQTLPGDLVAVSDAVVTAVYPRTGTVWALPGQAVRKGQVLISGATDLGLCTRLDRAEGEIYGLTRRTVEAVLPANTLQRLETGGVVRRYSLRIGKKYVNFSDDSGILYGTCVKMRTVEYLTLPGGFSLPVALVTDTYRMCETEAIPREIEPEELMEQARRYVREQMRSGTIEQEDMRFTGGALSAVFECREMIGAFRPGIYREGDTNERETGERGAG